MSTTGSIEGMSYDESTPKLTPEQWHGQIEQKLAALPESTQKAYLNGDWPASEADDADVFECDGDCTCEIGVEQ